MNALAVQHPSMTRDRFNHLILKHPPRQLVESAGDERARIENAAREIVTFVSIASGDDEMYVQTLTAEDQKIRAGVYLNADGQPRWRTACGVCDITQAWCAHTLALLERARRDALRGHGQPLAMRSGNLPVSKTTVDATALAPQPRAVDGGEVPAAGAEPVGVADWLTRFAEHERSAPVRPPAHTATLDGEVIYRLFLQPAQNQRHTVLVRPVYEAHSDLAPEQRINLNVWDEQNRELQHLMGRLPDADRVRLSLLAKADTERSIGRDYAVLSGRWDYALLCDLVRTGRCTLSDGGYPADVPLKLESPRRLDARWENQDGHWKLHLEPHLARPKFLDLPEPMVIDRETGMAIPLTSPPAPILDLLLKSPAIPAEVFAFPAVDERWQAIAERYQLPLPGQPAEIPTLTEVPRGVVVLSARKATKPTLRWGLPNVELCATLSYIYGKAMVRHAERGPFVLSQDDEGAPVRYARDAEREGVIEAALRRARLLPNSRARKYTHVSIQPVTESEMRSAAVELAEALSREGVPVEFDASLAIQMLESERGFAEATDAEGGRWLDIDIGVEIEGEQVSLVQVASKIIEHPAFTLDDDASDGGQDQPSIMVALPDGRPLRLSPRQARTILAPVLDWIDGGAPAAKKIKVSRASLVAKAVTDGQLPEQLRWPGAEQIRAAAEALRHGGIEEVPVRPEGFVGELRSYQQEGVAWLGNLERVGLGGILADDMGLGKTVQLLASILMSRTRRPGQKPVLLVVPTSLVHNWVEEAAKFTPSLRVLSLHGPDRADRFASIPDSDIVISTYPLIRRDARALQKHAYSLGILDEANAIKNDTSATRETITQLAVERFLLVTGTPIENQLNELWSFADLGMPGLLGDKRQFGKRFKSRIEAKSGDEATSDEARKALTRRIKPFILRRKKEDVLTELPPKTVVVRNVELNPKARQAYDLLRSQVSVAVRQAIAARGIAQSTVAAIQALQQMQRFCCHPSLADPSGKASAGMVADKLEELMLTISEMLADGRRILVFSQYVGFLHIIDTALRALGHAPLMLHGGTKDRAPLIEAFQAGRSPIFLISLKAGGVGLNLTRADTVIHASPWWNGAAEEQAEDRAHRMGQVNPVFVYKFIVRDSVEEHALTIQGRKLALAESVLDDGVTTSATLTEEDINLFFAK